MTFDPADPDRTNAEVYRCRTGAASPASPAVATPDPASIHRMLLGTWTGTLSAPPPRVGGGWVHRTDFPATVPVWEESGKLRWTLEVGNEDLNESGTVTHFFHDITLTGTYGQSALPITYSLRLSGPTLEGSGVGPDQSVRGLSLRKQP